MKATCLLRVGILVLTVLGSNVPTHAGYIVTPPLPPLSGPAPGMPGSTFTFPAVGSLFTPPFEIAETIGMPFWNQREVSIAHPTTSTWVVETPVIFENNPGRDHINFSLDLNFVPPIGASPGADLYVIFEASASNPWGIPTLFSFHLNTFDNPFFLSPEVPEPPFPTGSWGYALVLTDHLGIVLSTLDPVLSRGPGLVSPVPPTLCGPDDSGGGDPDDRCGPGGRRIPVPEPGTLLLVSIGLAIVTRSLTRQIRSFGHNSVRR